LPEQNIDKFHHGAPVMIICLPTVRLGGVLGLAPGGDGTLRRASPAWFFTIDGSLTEQLLKYPHKPEPGLLQIEEHANKCRDDCLPDE